MLVSFNKNSIQNSKHDGKPDRGFGEKSTLVNEQSTFKNEKSSFYLDTVRVRVRV